MAWLVCVKRDDREPFQFVNDIIEVISNAPEPEHHYWTSFILLELT